MAYGTGLSTAAIGSLVNLMKRPSRADKAINANADMQASSQAFNAQQAEANYQRTAQQNALNRNASLTSQNADRNARADEIFTRQQNATSMMERGFEMEMEKQEANNAFRLQNLMTQRKTSGVPGGTMRPVGENENSFARISGAGGEEMNYTPAGGTTYQPPGLYLPDGPNQIRPPRPIESSASSMSSDDNVQRAMAVFKANPNGVNQRGLDKAIRVLEAQPQERAKWRTWILKEMLRVQQKAADSFMVVGDEAYAAVQNYMAELTNQLNDLGLSEKYEADPGAKREVTSAAQIPDAVVQDAFDYADDQGLTPRTPEYDEAFRMFIRNAGFGK